MESLWKKDIQMPEFPELSDDISVETLIIGGGMAGILTAYLLEKQGADYVLVEKNRICSGVTGNTTAKITYQHGLVYNKILSSYGVETAKRYFNAFTETFREYENICSGIDCHFEYKDNYVYSSDPEKLQKEMEALYKIGYDAQFCTDINLPVSTAGAVKFKNQAQFHPLEFVSAIAEGLKIYENTFVREIKGTTAFTDKGKIMAEKIIVATHFPFVNKHGFYFLKLYQHRSYVLALKSSQKVDGMYVDEDKKGMSFRDYGDYLLLGGGGHRTGKKGGNWDELRQFAQKHYPQATEEFHWAAQDCMSLDDIPYIGEYSGNTPNLFVATGFNKWGMTGAMLSAKLLVDKINGDHNEFFEVFDPSRSILKPQLFANVCETMANFCTITTKRCPHMGCALKWNSTEHSWDCACHGSRLAPDGHVLDNPANSK